MSSFELELENSSENRGSAQSNTSPDLTSDVDTRLSSPFTKQVLLSDIVTKISSKKVVFSFDAADGPQTKYATQANDEPQAKEAPGPASGEIFHAGEIVPNVAFSACKPGCTHSEVEHRESASSGEGSGPTGNVRLVSASSNVVELRAAKKTAPKPSKGKAKGKLCDLCKSVDFWTLPTGFEHRLYVELGQYAESCEFCALLLDSVLEPETFVHDPSKKIRLLGKCNTCTHCLDKIEVRYPSLEKDRGDPAKPPATYVRCTELDVFVDHEHPYPHYFTGRTVGAADDPAQMTRWLKTCAMEHEACSKDASLRGNHMPLEPSVLPTRVIDVGGTAEHPAPFLFESEGARAQYLTLSHRWGNSNMSMTTNAVLKEYKDELPFDSLCKTFQDAIIITRKLGFQYIWIDALCIIQDSEKDWRIEAMKMADIYRFAIISLSASLATSGDSGLIYPREEHRSVQLPLRAAKDYRSKPLTYSVSPRFLSSFHEDVENGALAKRAWCLQERILPLRIIHFGQDQLHWECTTLSFSESSTTKIKPLGTVRDMRQILAVSEGEWQQQRMEVVKNELPADGRLKQIYGRGHYGKWYEMITEYTKREITKETDRLPALGGLAQAWIQRMPEIYACGLWNEDLAAGLLWAGSSFYAQYEAPSNLRKPAERTAPSWSWLSLDGPIEYPLGKLGTIDIERPWFVGATDQETLTTVGGAGPAFVRITGRMRPLAKMRSFSPEMLDHLEHNHQNYSPDHYPRIVFDLQEKNELWELWCLLIAFRGCGSKTCAHNAGCALGLAYALCLLPNAETGCYKRVGIAQTSQSDWEGVDRNTIVLE